VPKPVSNFKRGFCVARVWAQGQGAQCSRAPLAGAEYCSQHNVEAQSAKGLTHGRIDQAVPVGKVETFIAASMWRSAGIADEPDGGRQRARNREPTAAAAAKRRFSGRSCFGMGFVSDEVVLLVLGYLQNSDIFRTAMVCAVLNRVAETPLLYRRLSFGAVGRTMMRNGRMHRLSRDLVFAAIAGFLKQPRFRAVVELDFSEVPFGANSQHEVNLVLRHAASFLPCVNFLRLGSMDRIANTLAHRLPPAFERDVRSCWGSHPVVVEIGGCRYNVE